MKSRKPKAKVAKKPTQKELIERLEWGTRIITLQQGEIDRLMKLVDKLTDTLNGFSRRD